MEYVELNNGVKMPMLGYGVYQTPPEETERCVLEAVDVGYRSIDTAQAYGNEEGVGSALAKSGLPREEFFLTTKVWISNAGYERAKASIEESLQKLRTSYLDLLLIHQPFGDYYGTYRAMEEAYKAGKVRAILDLLLIHQPFGDYYGTYRAMEEAYKAGKVRAIGVSNFYPDRLIDLYHFAEIKPAVNQIETHVFQQQETARKYLKDRGVQIESWGPFAEGKNNFFQNPVLVETGKKYGKTAAQTALRFLIQSGVVAIPKSTHRERMEENFQIFDFALTEEEMQKIRALDTGESLFFSHYDPKTVEWFMTFA